MSVARELYSSPRMRPQPSHHPTLLDLLDRLLAGGVVVHGRVILAAADVDLVELDLSVVVGSVDKLAGQ